MAITNENGGIPATMLVGPTSGMPYYVGQGGSGSFDNGNGWWIILLFILLASGNWGNGGFGGQAVADGSVQRGFDQAALTSGLGDIQASINTGFGGIAQQLNANQIADMQNSFAMQSQFSNCCCENRLATLQTQNVVQNEGAATRLAIQQQTQAILDKMCQQEIDNLKAQNVALQNQVNMQNLAASQVSQTAQLIADNTAQTQYIVNRVAPYPIPAYVVANPATPATT